MKYFVSADIHGFYDEWISALNDRGFDINNPEHMIIVCGDLFDRGRQPKQIIDFILSNPDKFILVRGNHEDLMENMIDNNKSSHVDDANGTSTTIYDLCPEWNISEFSLKRIARKTRLQNVLDLCIDYYETRHYVFVHGWIPIIDYSCKYDKNWRNATLERWRNARWLSPVKMYKYGTYDPTKIIVCGHWHCSALWHAQNPMLYNEYGARANYEPFITDKMIALDGCTAYTKKVNVVVIED